MATSRWQKQHIHFRRNVWGASAVLSMLLLIILVALGVEIEVAGIFFIITLVISRIALALLFNNRFANVMVRILKFDYEEIERDFRLVFKNHNIRYYRTVEEDAYYYEFPGRQLTMTVQPYWLSVDRPDSVTKVTLRLLNEKNKAFAGTLADAIDDMAARLAAGREEA